MNNPQETSVDQEQPQPQPMTMTIQDPTESESATIPFLSCLLKWKNSMFVSLGYSLRPVVLATILYVNLQFPKERVGSFVIMAPLAAKAMLFWVDLLIKERHEQIGTDQEYFCTPFARCIVNLISAIASFGYCFCFFRMDSQFVGLDEIYTSQYQLLICSLYWLHQILVHVGGRTFVRNIVSISLVIYIVFMTVRAKMDIHLSFDWMSFPSLFGTTIVTMGAVLIAYPVDVIKHKRDLPNFHAMTILIMLFALIWQIVICMMFPHNKEDTIYRYYSSIMMMLGVIEYISVPVEKMGQLVPKSRVFMECCRVILFYTVFMVGTYMPLVSNLIVMIGSFCSFYVMTIIPIINLSNVPNRRLKVYLMHILTIGFSCYLLLLGLAFQV